MGDWGWEVVWMVPSSTPSPMKPFMLKILSWIKSLPEIQKLRISLATSMRSLRGRVGRRKGESWKTEGWEWEDERGEWEDGRRRVEDRRGEWEYRMERVGRRKGEIEKTEGESEKTEGGEWEDRWLGDESRYICLSSWRNDMSILSLDPVVI